MDSAVLLSRFQFGFTLIFHYLFPQLTMSLAVLVAYFRLHEYWGDRQHYRQVTAFWTKILAITFAFGVVTGIPLEFQFGTNWGAFSRFSGGVIGQTLALEGTFAFFLESVFLGIMLAGQKRVGQRLHLIATLLVTFGVWLSAYFILATNAWMQHPVAWERQAADRVAITSFWGLLGNRWLFWQYLHNQSAAMVTGSFVLAAVGAFFLLSRKHEAFGRTFVLTGVIVGAVCSCLQIYPTGHGESRQVGYQQHTKAAAMEGLFRTQKGAPIAIMGQPNMTSLDLDNPIYVPKALSFLLYGHTTAPVAGLTAFPRDTWPDNVPLVYYAYHIMVGLGTFFVGIMLICVCMLWRGKLYKARWMLWVLMLSAPFPYIATTAGWVTAEVGRQPWIAWELIRTSDGGSPLLVAGNVMFTLLGFLALYLGMGMAYFLLCFRVILVGPQEQEA